MNIPINPEVTDAEIRRILTNAGLYFDGHSWRRVPAWLCKRPLIVVPMQKRMAAK